MACIDLLGLSSASSAQRPNSHSPSHPPDLWTKSTWGMGLLTQQRQLPRQALISACRNHVWHTPLACRTRQVGGPPRLLPPDNQRRHQMFDQVISDEMSGSSQQPRKKQH